MATTMTTTTTRRFCRRSHPPLRLRPLHVQVKTEGGDGERLAALPGSQRNAGRGGEGGEDRKDGSEAREEDPFALIAAGIESLVSGFASQARKKTAAFLAQSSTLYSLLFEDIVELFRRERENRVRER